MRRFLLFFWIVSLVLGGCFLASAQFRAKVKISILCSFKGLSGATTLNALVDTADNESWWDTTFLNTSLRAIGQWNEAITGFAANYSDFSSVSSLKIQPTFQAPGSRAMKYISIGHESPFRNST